MKRDLVTYLLIKGMTAKGYRDLKSLEKNTINAREKNEKLLFRILKAGENSEYGKKYDFKGIRTVEEYRKNVPLTRYDDYLPYIERMINNNEEDLLTSYPLIGYSQTSGTTGKPKFIPLTQNIADLYKKHTLTTMCAMADKWCREKYGRPLKPGRGMFVLVDFDEKLPNGRSATNAPEITGKQLSFLYPYLLSAPFKRLFKQNEVSGYYLALRFALEDQNTMFISNVFFSIISEMLDFMINNWKIFVDDIEKGTIDEKLGRPTPQIREEMMKYIRPNPERAAELRKEFEKGVDETLLQRIWPNLSVIFGISGSVYTNYANNVRRIAGDIPYDLSIYGASEGLFAAPHQLNTERRLLVIESCYFEFIPVDDETKILNLDELEKGKEYEIVITNQAGLYRYRIGDIVKVEGYLNQCPYVTFSRRKGNLVSISGEKTTEQHLESLVQELKDLSGCLFENWIITVDHSSRPSHYNLIIENDKGIDMSVYSDKADELMCKINSIYNRFRYNKTIGKMTISNQEPGTHAAWRLSRLKKGTAPTQIKPVRILDTQEKSDFFLKHIK